MAAPILWTPGKMRLFCRKNNVHKIPRFRGGGGILVLGGGECRFYFYGREDFSDLGFRAPGKANLPRTLVFRNQQFQPSRDFLKQVFLSALSIP